MNTWCVMLSASIVMAQSLPKKGTFPTVQASLSVVKASHLVSAPQGIDCWLPWSQLVPVKARAVGNLSDKCCSLIIQLPVIGSNINFLWYAALLTPSHVDVFIHFGAFVFFPSPWKKSKALTKVVWNSTWCSGHWICIESAMSDAGLES